MARNVNGTDLDGLHEQTREASSPASNLDPRTSDLLLSPLLDGHFQALRTAARLVAAPALQNRGTVGGNVLQNTRCFYYNQSTLFRAGLDPCFKLGGSVCHALAVLLFVL